ncbi:MAG: c-type cytochrome [Flavobacteriales bacterium]
MNVISSVTIAPLMATMCTGCHGLTNPGGSLDLTDFTTMHTITTDGRLAGIIQHQSPFKAMPPSGAGLSECHIQQVLVWIQQGAPNN